MLLTVLCYWQFQNFGQICSNMFSRLSNTVNTCKVKRYSNICENLLPHNSNFIKVHLNLIKHIQYKLQNLKTLTYQNILENFHNVTFNNHNLQDIKMENWKYSRMFLRWWGNAFSWRPMPTFVVIDHYNCKFLIMRKTIFKLCHNKLY